MCSDDDVIPATPEEANVAFTNVLTIDNATSCATNDSTSAEGCLEVLTQPLAELASSPEESIQDPALYLQSIELQANETSLFSLDLAVDEVASVVDLPTSSIEVASMTLAAANIPAATSAAAIVSAAGVPDPAYWQKIAEDKALESLGRNYVKLYKSLSKVATVVAISSQPNLCTQVSRSIIDTCKKGVRSQVAYCKQELRDSIAQCKNDVRGRIDRCKKRKASYDAFGKAACEADRLPANGKCELGRIDIPLCEFDRLTAACCEGTRPQAQALCYSGVSQAQIQKQVQSVQVKCSIVTAVAKAATKSYLSGQAVGLLTELQAVKEIGETVKIVQKFQSTKTEFEKYANGLTAAAEGRYADAQKLLGSLAAQLPKSIANGVAWAERAQAVVAGRVDGFLNTASAAVAELDLVRKAKATIDVLRPLANDIQAISKAADECGRITTDLFPASFPSIGRVTNEAEALAAVAEYEKFIAARLYKVANCRAVVTRVDRALKAAAA